MQFPRITASLSFASSFLRGLGVPPLIDTVPHLEIRDSECCKRDAVFAPTSNLRRGSCDGVSNCPGTRFLPSRGGGDPATHDIRWERQVVCEQARPWRVLARERLNRDAGLWLFLLAAKADWVLMPDSESRPSRFPRPASPPFPSCGGSRTRLVSPNTPWHFASGIRFSGALERGRGSSVSSRITV